ncbi:MAG: polymer-forming cytoskeletal protein [Patescibacteria group bacterium]|nr:polymer-forming cytoskeletal protein [Patescibacteria group bacterium]MDE2588685.1 polymer-forming cytoskeletal protein [Patescibacteria group bacterium]
MNKFFANVFIFLLLAFSLVFPQHIFAQTTGSGNVVTLRKNQTINGDYFSGGQTVVIHGTVNGDVYAIGGNVQIDGTINGDILAFGATVLLQGNAHNIRVAGGNVTVDSTVDGNVTALGGNVTIADSAKIVGSLVSAGGQINVFASTGKGATLAGGQTTISSSINGNLLAAGNITLTPQAKVNGTFTYWSNHEASIENGASITGKVTHNFPPKYQKPRPSMPRVVGAAFGFSLMSLVSAFILGFLLLKMVPLFTMQTITTMQQQPWMSFGIGLIGAIVTPIIAFMLFLTIFGIPLAVLLMIAYGVFVYISKIFVALAIGIWILNKSQIKKEHLVWALFVGLVIYEILQIIPIIGWIVTCIFWLMGFGALLITKRNAYITLRSKKLL